jgi:PAS domain S-box-containing protein
MTADNEVKPRSIAAEEALWRLVAALADSGSLYDVAAALAHSAGAAAGGTFANLAVLTEGSPLVHIVRSDGRNPTASPQWASFALDEELPACEAIRTGLPVLLSSPDDIRRRFPAAAVDIAQAGLRARASVPLHSAAGTTLGAIGIGWSTTQAFSAPQLRRLDLIAELSGLALQRSSESTAERQRPAQVLETMPNALLSLDSDLSITYVNGEAERLLRLSREALVGRRLTDIFPENSLGQLTEDGLRNLESGQPVTFEEYFAPLEGWFEVHLWPDDEGLNIYFADITDRRVQEVQKTMALDEVGRANVRLRFLADLNSTLAGTMARSVILERLSRLMTSHICDWCTIVVPSEGELVRVAAAHKNPDLDELAKRLVGTYPHPFDGPSPGVVAYKSGQPVRLARLAGQIVEDLDESVASAAYGRTLLLLGDGPGVVMPISSGDRVSAVLTMVRTSEKEFDDDDLEVLGQVAARVSASLDDALTLERLREAAGALQAAALPKELPAVNGLSLAAGYKAATEGSQVGGDWYDAFELPNGDLAVVVGDAAGHGIQAASLMARMRNVLRAHLFEDLGPAESLSRLSGFVATQEPGAFATVICLEIDAADGLVTWSTAGHPAPILLRRDGTSNHLRGRIGLPIGTGTADYLDRYPQIDEQFVMGPGDRLVLFTDGLIERRGTDIDIGLAHLMLTVEATRDTPNAVACEEVLQRVLPADHEDDVCLLIADYVPTKGH